MTLRDMKEKLRKHQKNKVLMNQNIMKILKKVVNYIK